MFVKWGWGSSRGRRKTPGLCDVALVVEEEVRMPVTGRTDGSCFDPFVQTRFVKLWQEASVSEWIRGTDSGHLSRRLGDENENSLHLRSLEVATERGKELTAEKVDLQLRLNGYEMSKEIYKTQSIVTRRY